jgi:outer membrane autotransporter protein
LRITNRGGAGALTTGDGIMVVRSAIANTTGAFVLEGGTVTAGGFSYSLKRGAKTPNPATDNNWYLVSTMSAEPPAQTVPATTTPLLILVSMMLIGMVVWLRRRSAYPG